MDDEMQPQALNEQPEQAPTEQPSPADEQEPVAATQAETEQPEEKPAKENRAQRRISDLTKQLKEAKAREEQLQALTSSQDILGAPAIDPWQQYHEGEITLDQLKGLVETSSRSSAQFAAQVEAQKLRQELAEKEFWGGFEADVHQMEAQNPRFNPSSPEFDQQYVEELSQLYLDAYGKEPNRLMQAPKLSQFVSRIERMRARAEAEGQSRSSAQLAEQAAQGAVIGTGAPVATKSTAKESLKAEGLRTGNFRDYFKTLADE